MADQTLQIHVGVYLQSKLIDESIHFAKKNDCHFFAFDLIDDQSENEFILYSDKASDIYSWNNSVVGKLKPNFDQLDLQLKWASHLSIKYLLAWQINADILNFSRKIYKALIETPEFNGEIWIPFRIIKEDVSKSIDFFTLIPNQNNIFPVLLLDGDIDRERLDYWFSKNVRCLLIKTNQFETNEDGDPILSNFLTKTVLSFLEREINILIVSDDLNDQNDYVLKFCEF
ncbi:hypothetical protein MHBO_003403 [Bonamia ostreae]|uniref:PRMT5 TIM barrel domain-containing protein n=1 Tax=Bonamia ostreae TaxID=126728 RepID=A0ABV2AQV5_9EUKA